LLTGRGGGSLDGETFSDVWSAALGDPFYDLYDDCYD